MASSRFWCLDKLDLIGIDFKNSVDLWFCREKIRTLKVMLEEQNGYYVVLYNPQVRRSLLVKVDVKYWSNNFCKEV